MLRRLAALSQRTQLLLLLVSAVVLVLIFFFLPLPDRSFFWRALQNSGHGVLFGAVALVVVWFSHLVFPRRRAWVHYLLAFVVTATAGATTEIIQGFIGRDADLDDLFRDCVGAWSLLLLFATVDPFFDSVQRWKIHRWAPAFWVVAIISMSGTFLPTLDWGIASLYRTEHMPILCDFDSRWGRKFVFVDDAHKEFAPWPPAAKEEPKNLSLKLTFWSTEYPTFALEEPHPDWTGYDSLIFLIWSPLSDPVRIYSRIHDINHNEHPADRWNKEIRVLPGTNRYAIPLSDIEQGPVYRDLDMRHIMSFKLFAHFPPDSFTIYIDSIYLR